MSDARVRVLTVALLAALAVTCLSRLELTNSILHFLPSSSDAELVELSLELVESPLARRMVLAVAGGDSDARRGVAAGLSETLAAHPEVAWVSAGFGEAAVRGLYELYFERRVYLVSDSPETEIPALLAPAVLERRAARLRNELAQPSSLMVSRTAPQDPLGLFQRTLDRIRRAQPAFASPEGGFTGNDGDSAIVLLGLRSSPFDSPRQAALLEHVEREFTRLDTEHGGGLRLEQSGVNRIAVATERSVRRDVALVSAVSVTGVCLLFLVIFRSLRHLLIAVLTPLGGFAAAAAVALSGSEPFHGITLAFGFVLVGVAIDYPIHLMNHHALAEPGARPRQTLARIRRSLLLSGLTTTLAFVALALSEFPGLGQMGSFAAVGVPVALGFTLLSIPAFLGPAGAATGAQLAIGAGFVRLVAWLGARPAVAAAFPLVFAGVAGLGLVQLRWEDDPGSLMAADPALLAEDDRVRGRVLDVDGGRFVVAIAADGEAALQLNDRIHRRLESAVAAGGLEGVRSLHSFLWSQALQRENLAALRATPDLGERIDEAFARSGFRRGAFRGFEAAVATPDAPPLRPEDLAGSPLERALDAMTELDGRFAVVTYLRGVRSGDAIRHALAGLEGAYYVDQREIIGAVYEGYRRSTLRMIVLGSAVVFLVLQLAYRSPRRGLLAFLPSALVALTTLGLFGLLGRPLNVVTAISLVVVLGMGVDYGVFTVDGARSPEKLAATMASLLVSCLTTLFVFGALALSEQPVLQAIGLTTGTGVLLALLLSPAVFVLARPGEPR